MSWSGRRSAGAGSSPGRDYHRSMRRSLRSAGSVLLIAAAIGVSWIRLPYYSFGPGPAREVTPLIHLEDVRTYGSAGHLVMTTIRFDQLTALGMLATWIDPGRSIE